MWHLFECRLFLFGCVFLTCVLFLILTFFTNCMYFILFYRLNFIVLHRELHHVRFDVVFLILAGPFLGRPVLCCLLPHAGLLRVRSRRSHRSADRERDREQSPLLSCSFSRGISPSSKTAVARSNRRRPRNRRPQEVLIPAFRVVVRSASPCRCAPAALSCLFPSPPPLPPYRRRRRTLFFGTFRLARC